MEKDYYFRRFYLQDKTLCIEDIKIKIYKLKDDNTIRTQVSLKNYGFNEFKKILGKIDLQEHGVFILNRYLYTLKYRIYELYFHVITLINNNNVDDQECCYACKRYINIINESIRKSNSSKRVKIPLIQETLNVSNINRIRTICNNDENTIHSIVTLTTLPKILLPYKSIMDIPYYHSSYISL